MPNIRNFVIIAHIDHGKSTLADRLLEKCGAIAKGKNPEQVLDTMDLERERGITIKLQPAHMKYTLNNQEYEFNLIDTPGHVDFNYEVNRSLAAVEGAILLVDATSGIQAQTIANLNLAQKNNLTIIPVVNKIDLPNAEIDKTVKEICVLLNIDKNEVILTSAKTGEGVDDILKTIITKIPSPKININAPLQALVFDSIYDNFRGVIAYVRLFNGQIKQGQNLKLMATGSQTACEELGTICLKYSKLEELSSGEIGYLVTGLKQVQQCRVGDTITNDDNPAQNVLEGYAEPQPMVYACVYIQDEKNELLRDALEKLKLNDASLMYEPSNSPTFGYGFKIGFLGLLHMEIVKERLEREYKLNLIFTTPTVDYHISTDDHGQPQYQEPWANLEVITPPQYVGTIMELLQNNRGKYKEINYLADRTILIYECPLSEIIINFYDQLKSVSQGYASMAYDFIGYRPGDLVKLEILIAGEKIDSLSQIVPKEKSNKIAQNLAKHLKILIPKQLFEVSLQILAGGKIIAREDIPPLRKDVIAKLYGGDVTRKNKLLDKQKAGKKKMKQLGKINIPSDVFLKLIKNKDF